MDTSHLTTKVDCGLRWYFVNGFRWGRTQLINELAHRGHIVLDELIHVRHVWLLLSKRNEVGEVLQGLGNKSKVTSDGHWRMLRRQTEQLGTQ